MNYRGRRITLKRVSDFSKKVIDVNFFKEKNQDIHRKNDSICQINYNGRQYRMYLPNISGTDVVQREIYYSKSFYEYDYIPYFEKYLVSSKSVVVDVGANIGNHTLIFSSVLNVKLVHSFEPMPDTFKILQKNTELNNLQNVVLNNLAVGSRDAYAVASVYNPNDLGGTNVMYQDGGNLPVISLDNYFSDKPQLPSLIKIDVEGFELEVLKGGTQIISKAKPVIFIESHPHQYPDIKKFFEDIGYKLYFELGYSNYIYGP